MSISTSNGTKITAGIPSLFKQTPQEVKGLYRACILLGILWGITVTSYPSIPPNIKLDVFSGISYMTGITYAIAQFFGISLPANNANNSNQPPAQSASPAGDAPVVHLPHQQ